MNINDLEEVSKEWLEEASETTPAAILELIAAGKRLAVRLNGKSALSCVNQLTQNMEALTHIVLKPQANALKLSAQEEI